MASTVTMAATPEVFQPTAAQRRDSLEKHLQQRPNPQELKDRHILLDTNAAPSLQSTQQELERRLATDNLKKGLATRSERVDLVERNILSSSGGIAPALESPRRELEKHMRRDSLEKALQRRPLPETLIKDKILIDDNDRLAASEAAIQPKV